MVIGILPKTQILGLLLPTLFHSSTVLLSLRKSKSCVPTSSHRVLQSILTPSFLYKEEDTQSSSQTSIWPASRVAADSEICFYSSCLLCLIGKIQFKTLVLLLLLDTVRGEHCKSSMQQTYQYMYYYIQNVKKTQVKSRQ